MTFLAGWRLALVADLLRDSGSTIGAVARQVGYGSSFALSTAFKRVLGISLNSTGSAPPRADQQRGSAQSRADQG